MKLGGWTRLGIVASVIWAIGAGVFIRTGDLDAAARIRSVHLRLCISDQYLKHDFNQPACERKAADNYNLYLEHSWARTTAAAFMPVALTWFVVWLIVVVTRWVRRGFA